MPVIQSGTFELAVVDLKAQGADKVKHTAGDGAGAGNVAGVLRDLRADKHEMKHNG